ncbi:MAG: ImmA/IrrE family metallo-endopeptidase [Rhodobacteraceae bacterium]|nr:ImmA/IrrE family metallo-endopeptidase [Paracoccaceae bacterium]
MLRPWKPKYSEAEATADALTEPITAPPIPVQDIAESNGVEVVFVDFGEYKREVSGLCDFGEKRIYVNAEDSRARRAFTMAHELGHWLLHKEHYLQHPEEYPILPRFSVPDNSNPLEKEANKFAACLLMPRHLLRPVKTAPVAQLARIFGVSQLAMSYRLRDV